MRANILLIILALGVCVSCKKDKPTKPLTGVWVEASLNLDTLDFEFQGEVGLSGQMVRLRSAPYSDPVLNPTFPVTHAAFYNYKIEKDSIGLLNSLSSTLTYRKYSISFSGDGRMLTIGKFYDRRALPPRIMFTRIQ